MKKSKDNVCCDAADFSAFPLPSPYSSLTASLCSLHFFALLLAAIGLRIFALGNIPGVNGDEAWYGVTAWRILHGEEVAWHTPTGNPLNPFYLGPLVLLHICFPPSIVLLRTVALLSGIAALAINWFFCRWVFDRRTAAFSTVLLAIVPLDIAYSRFGWDASQSLAATLPVIYFALAAVRFPEHFGRWIAASLLALAVAFWVHPTNIFVGAITSVVFLINLLRKTAGSHAAANREETKIGQLGISRSTVVLLGLTAVLVILWCYAAQWSRGPLRGRLLERLANFTEVLQPDGMPPTAVLYARLFTGGTIYRYIAGSRSWFEWPLPQDLDGWGLDVVAFWIAVFTSVWLLERSRQKPIYHRGDLFLPTAWLLQLLAFVVAAGPPALAPGYERFAVGLIGLVALLLSRGAMLVYEAAAPRWRYVLMLVPLLGWFWMADFYAHYFRFIEQTGGQAHLTFRAASVDPKQAALEYILKNASTIKDENASQQDIWIVCSEWWNLWPIRYLALPTSDVRVVTPEEAEAFDGFEEKLRRGQIWYVEFFDSPGDRAMKARFTGQILNEQCFYDYAGRPLLDVVRPGLR